MPFIKSRYPKDWPVISKRIRERSGGRCECTGECGVSHALLRCIEQNKTAAIYFKGKVVLTVAHLNHKCMDCDDDNLKAMCQRCHNRYDMPHRLKNRLQSNAVKRSLGTLPLF